MAVDIEKVRKSLEVCPIKWVGDGKFTNEILDERHVRVVVPVEGLHLNHVGIVYAGTMFTAMELAAGAIFMCTYGLDEFVPIVSNFEISFLKPTKKDLVAEIEWTEEEAAERIKPIRERGRGRMPVEITLRDIDGVVAFGRLVGEGCLRARERRERQRKGQRRGGHSFPHHERLTSLLFTTLRGSSVTTTSTMSAINVRNSRRPAHISSI